VDSTSSRIEAKHTDSSIHLWRTLKRLIASVSRNDRGARAKARLLAASGFFDKAWYLAHYPDVASAGIDPVLHYLKYGATEGRDPGPGFDTLWYLETNPDVATAGLNPLYHFAKAGRKEGRTPRPQTGPIAQFDVPAKPASDTLVRSLGDPAERSGILDLFKACDPTLARVLEINAEAWAALVERRHATDEPIVIVACHNEISNAHGTGVLLKRMFGKLDSVLTIRPWSNFNNRDELGFANIWLGNAMLTDSQIYRLFSFLLAGQRARCVMAVPYDDMDLRVALRVAEILSAPLVPYIMDDNNVIGRRISDSTMRQAIQLAPVRFVISTEMRQAYEGKFLEKFFVLPPLVPPHFLSHQATARSDIIERGVIVGNIWRQGWLDDLLKLLEISSIHLDWICNSADPKWLSFDRARIAEQGLHFHEPMSEEQLVDHVRRSPFCVMPTIAGTDDASSVALAQLSLPSRIILVAAACQTPIIVVGDATTAAARFVRRFGVGVAVAHDPQALVEAIRIVLEPVARAEMQANAANIAQCFSSDGIVDWLFASIQSRQAFDDRFDALLSTAPGDLAYFVDKPCPTTVDHGRRDTFRALRRLESRGFLPDFVIDAGASNGVWSHAVTQLFPQARFLLVEPLFSRYQARLGVPLIDAHPNFEVTEAALLDQEGEIDIQVSGDIFNSSALGVRLTGVVDVIKVPAITLDRLAKEGKLTGRGLLKIDVQYAEHLVLDGGRELLRNQIDAVIIEMTLRREHPDALTFLEICNKMNDLGFDYEDDAGEWRSPIDGRLEQKDVLFTRQQSPWA
jgi:FkbM family methyltransferase